MSTEGRCSAAQRAYAAGKLSEQEQAQKENLFSETLDPHRDVEWQLPNGTVLPHGFTGHTGIFIRDPNRTAAGKKIWFKSLFEWRGWETNSFGEKAIAALNEIYENPVGRKLINSIMFTTPGESPGVPTGYKAIIVRPFDLDPTDDMAVHENDFSEVELLLDRIASTELTPDQINNATTGAKAMLKTEWNLARVRIGECFLLHGPCKNVLSDDPPTKADSNNSCPVPNIDAKVDAVADLAGLRTVAGQLKAFIDASPRYWIRYWRDGSHIANSSFSGAATKAGKGKPSVVTFNPVVDHQPGVHISDNNGAITYTYVRYNNGQVKQEIGGNTAIPVSLALAHELIHVLHMLKGEIPAAGTNPPSEGHYRTHCTKGGTADADGLKPGVTTTFPPYRAHEEWLTTGIHGTVPDAAKWPACVQAGGNLERCALTENNVRAAWRTNMDGSPGRHPNLPTRASYTSRINCQLDQPPAEPGDLDEAVMSASNEEPYAPYSFACGDADAAGEAAAGGGGAWGKTPKRRATTTPMRAPRPCLRPPSSSTAPWVTPFCEER